MNDYWRFHGDLTLSGSLLLYKSRIVVPARAQQTLLEKVYHDRQGM